MKRLAWPVAIIAAIVAADRITKLYIRSAFSAFEIHPVIPGIFNIVHVENPGAAFGMLSDSPSFWSHLFLACVSLVEMAIVAFLLWKPERAGMRNTALLRVALSLVFGGALGNLWDRLFRGTVTDFLQVFIGSYEYPSFNVADSAVTIGAVLLAIELLRSRKPS